MLFIESRTTDFKVEESLRTPLLEALQERGLVPAIRASRLNFFEQSLAGDERVREFEQAIAERSALEGDARHLKARVLYRHRRNGIESREDL